jgi:L-alanine-DL-glutamate epimerase-like enolase superfamily enzyme
MKRRHFISLASCSAGLASLGNLTSDYFNAVSLSSSESADLATHKITGGELLEVNYHWPRFVGKNGRIDFHGQYKKSTVLRLFTDQGASGWGLSGKQAVELMPGLINKKVSELIIPGKGIIPGLNRTFDFALHDLMGVIVNKPVYKLLGARGNRQTPVYSGMIYLDELNPENKIKGFDAVMENCEWDYNFGYRQLKVKIGRSGRWYPHDEGLAKDIEIVKRIHNSFKDRKTQILVDSNDMYTLDDTISFLKGIGDIPLFWVEEPFREEAVNGRSLRKWMNENGFSKTYYADGEANPDYKVCMELGKEGVMDVFLDDIYGKGFTEWIKLMEDLRKLGMLSSPHAWGDRLKTNYIAHIASGLGNVATIEGVTCLSEDIDYGDYRIENGRIRVSDAPGFGMKLLKKS